jgi:hypothetical protein
MASESTAANPRMDTDCEYRSKMLNIIKYYENRRDVADKKLEQDYIPKLQELLHGMHQVVQDFEKEKADALSHFKWNADVGFFSHDESQEIEQHVSALASRWITVLPTPESFNAPPPTRCLPDDAVLNRDAPLRALDPIDQVRSSQPPGGIASVAPEELPHLPSGEVDDDSSDDNDSGDGDGDGDDESEYGRNPGSHGRKRQSTRRHNNLNKKHKAAPPSPPSDPSPTIDLSLLTRKISKEELEEDERVFSIRHVRLAKRFFVYRCGYQDCPERIFTKRPFNGDYASEHMAQFHGTLKSEVDLFHTYSVEGKSTSWTWPITRKLEYMTFGYERC